MSGAISGDFGELQHAIDTLKGLSEGATDRIAQGAAPLIASAVDEQMSLGVSATGDPWDSLTPGSLARGRTDPPFARGMYPNAQVTAQGSEIVIAVEDPPAIFHQDGTVNMVARPLLPEGDEAPAYELAVQQAAAVVMGVGQ
jgi:hypothetical protein